jgi:hypothetical protein
LIVSAFAQQFRCRNIQVDGKPYMDRYAINGWLPGDVQAYDVNVYLHHLLAPDHARHLHNHPWPWAVSVVLSGAYLERRADGEHWRTTGSTYTLTRDTYHHIVTLQGDVWTLFITGGKDRRPWGFDVPELGGFVQHNLYERLKQAGALSMQPDGAT